MRYAKLIEEFPSYAPNPIKYAGRRVANPPADVLLFLGYKPVQFADYPSEEPPEGYYWSESWTETQEQIVQSWVAVPIEE